MRWLLVAFGLLGVSGWAQTPPPPAGQVQQDPLKMGVQLYALGRYEAALALFERAAKENPANPDAFTGWPGPS